MTARRTIASATASALVLLASSYLALAQQLNFRAHLSGDEEVPSVETLAGGQAIFQVSQDGTEVSFRLIVANIANVRFAHIHAAPLGVAGPVVVTLYGGPTIPGRFDGLLNSGTITAADLAGPLAGQPLSALIELIEDGEAYVNVHTNQYPGGEIRGQVK